MAVTVIPQVPVRYNYSTPSMSRRGGTRLHPIRDGVAPMGEQLFWLRTRDTSGQKLADITHPRTGMCVGVRSPLECEPNNVVGGPQMPGVSGSHNVETRRAAVQYVPEHKVYVDEETGLVIRTTAMGDQLRPVACVLRSAQPKKERRVKRDNGGNAKPGAHVPGGTGKDGAITKADCEALIRAMAKGRSVTITKDMMINARRLLIQKRNQAAKVIKK